MRQPWLQRGYKMVFEPLLRFSAHPHIIEVAGQGNEKSCEGGAENHGV
jgi:hypothetical protein